MGMGSGVGGELQSCQSGKLVRDSGLFVILDYGGSMGDSLGIHPSELRGMDLGSTSEGGPSSGIRRRSTVSPPHQELHMQCTDSHVDRSLASLACAISVRVPFLPGLPVPRLVRDSGLTGVGGELRVILDYGGSMGDSLGIHP